MILHIITSLFTFVGYREREEWRRRERAHNARIKKVMLEDAIVEEYSWFIVSKQKKKNR
jgi:hypothetical protein